MAQPSQIGIARVHPGCMNNQLLSHTAFLQCASIEFIALSKRRVSRVFAYTSCVEAAKMLHPCLRVQACQRWPRYAGPAALPGAQEHPTHRPVHRHGVRPLQGLLEGLMMTGGRQVLAACPIVFCHRQLAARRSATEPPHREVTSPQAMAPCLSSVCARSAPPPCRPPASVGWACAWTWAMAQALAQPQMTVRWEPEARQAPPCLQ